MLKPISIGLLCLLTIAAFQNCGNFDSSEVTSNNPSSVATPDSRSQDNEAPISMDQPRDMAKSQFYLKSARAEMISPTEVKIIAEYSETTKLFIKYSPTIDNNQNLVDPGQTPGEASLDYSTHKQILSGLKPETQYFYQLIATNELGQELQSKFYDFTTKKTAPIEEVPQEPTPLPAVPTAAWPSDSPSYDENRAMAGLFYGNPWAGGFGGANGPMGTDLAISWRAFKTGNVTGFKFQHRYLRNSDIDSRCNTYKKGLNNHYKFYCECKDSGLYGNPELNGKCGYTSPAPIYMEGNGGRYRIEVRKANASKKPDMSDSGLIGTSTVDHIPIKHAQASWPEITIDSPQLGAPVLAGNTYFFVLKNLAPPPNNKLYGYTTAEAKAAPDDSGAISFNGVDYDDSLNSSSRFGPYLGAGPVTRYFYSTDNRKTWKDRSQHQPFFMAEMDNSVWFGHGHAAAYGRFYSPTDKSAENVRTIGGQVRGRQKYSPKKDFHLNGVWLNFGHMAAASNKKPLLLQVKNSSGAVIASAIVAHDSKLYAINNQGKSVWDRKKYNAKSWNYADLSSPVVFKKGETYYAEISAPAGAGFNVTGYETRGNALGAQKYSPEQIIVTDIGGFAQASTNGGTTWGNYSHGGISGAAYNQLPILFTTVGGPKSLK